MVTSSVTTMEVSLGDFKSDLGTRPNENMVNIRKINAWTTTISVRYIQVFPGGNVNILGGHNIRHSKQKFVYLQVSILNGFWDRATSLYSCKVVDKEILRIVCNIGIYCPSDKIGTVYLVQYIFENSTVNTNALCNSCDDMACCSSECILTFLYAGDNIH